MYIYDCLYGKIEFEKKMYRCMLSPELQRLREVRLGNINSLLLTGSANNNRFEHSVGTAYLAMVNIAANASSFSKEYNDAFVYAALFHDLGNGPFGHSYEYIVQKQGFNPEQSVEDVIFGRLTGSHRRSVTCEPFYLGVPNELSSILSRKEIEQIDKIVKGENPFCSKILSSVIDIDNIDNVYRMAYHMGLRVNKRAPIELAKGLICRNNTIFFKETAVPYLYDWYITRSNLYKLLLYNPQDFSAKCMLSELMENVLSRDRNVVRWQYTDAELMSTFFKINDEYWNENLLMPISLNEGLCEDDFADEDTTREAMKRLGVDIPPRARVTICRGDGLVEICYYNTSFVFSKGSLFKKIKKVETNVPKLAERLMMGDLYGCIGIFVSGQISKCDLFLDVYQKNQLEMECNYYIEKRIPGKNFQICFHGIVDKNKTNRQIEVQLETGEYFQIGENTHNLLIGAFVKNASFGLKKGDLASSRRKELSREVRKYLLSKDIICEEHVLYSEVDSIESENSR